MTTINPVDANRVHYNHNGTSQVIEVPSDVAINDDLLKQSMVAIVPWAANARIDRKDGKITLVKQGAGSNG